MKGLTNCKWFIEEQKLLGTLTIKADDGAKTPICRIATPVGKTWMENKTWYKNAMRKGELIASFPELLEAANNLLKQIDMSDYSEVNGHYLSNNIAVHKLKELINKLS